MGKLFLSITMSLDGYAAGPAITEENPMGLNGPLLHQWIFAGKQNEDEQIISGTFSNCGAVILGSRTYTTAINGVWEGRSPFPVPALVLSSQKLHMTDGFVLVNEGIQTALEQAKDIAKEKDILVMGGANTAQQFLAAGLLDEIQLHIAPILLGNGVRLFEAARLTGFTKTAVIDTPGATHLFLKPKLQ